MYVWVHVMGSEDKFVEPGLSFYPYMDSKDQT